MYTKSFAIILAAFLATGPHAPASAQQSPAFPLPHTTPDTTAQEGTAPFFAPAGVRQTLITDRATLTPMGLPASFGNWDMVAFDPTSRYVFVPAEVGSGAGVFRYDTQTGQIVTLMLGNGSGTRESDPSLFDPSNDDFSRLDPATLTPHGTIVTGEETTGGRLFEITNPLSPTGPYVVEWRDSIPAVAHEGVRFDSTGALYFVDENGSGSLYRFVPAVPGDLSLGQTFVLSVDAYASDAGADAAQSWDATPNRTSVRTGAATWVAMTDALGNPLTVADPFAYVTTTGGRTAADELKGTPYGRPEDIAVGTLASGNEVVYFTATSENRIYSVELLGGSLAFVREFVDFDTINLATGLDVNPTQNDPFTSPGPDGATNLDDPDNLAIDAFGDVYIIEDEGPGDIWKARDTDKDGVAEGIGLFLSLGVAGSEPTGFIADPNDPYRFIACIQHPSSGNDALWSFDTRPYVGTRDDLALLSGINEDANDLPGEFVKPARGNDDVHLRIVSPGGGLVGVPYIFFYGVIFSGNVPMTPSAPFLHLDPNTAVIVIDGTQGLFRQLVPASGIDFLSTVPPGLGGLGLSVMFQCAAVGAAAQNGFLAVSDGQELQLVN